MLGFAIQTFRYSHMDQFSHLGCLVCGILSFVFLVYSNTFLIFWHSHKCTFSLQRYASSGYDVTIGKVRAMPITKRVISLHAFKTMPCKIFANRFRFNSLAYFKSGSSGAKPSNTAQLELASYLLIFEGDTPSPSSFL